MVEIRDVVRLPQTRGMRPIEQDVNPSGWARVPVRARPPRWTSVRERLPWILLPARQEQPAIRLRERRRSVSVRDVQPLESGFIGFDFHPEFAKNGLFYTVHGERVIGNPATPNFIPPGYTAKDVTHHNVITEWRAKNPAANTFEGTRRSSCAWPTWS